MDDKDFSREEKIRQILMQEIRDGEDLTSEARKMVEYLLLEKKGYQPEDILRGAAFEVKLGRETISSSVDFIVSIADRKAMLIKCAAGSLDSRERQAVAAARIISSPCVPIAVVADPVNALVLDVSTGKVTGEGFGAIPVKEQLLRVLSETEPKRFSPERIEKEKRIFLAFDAIKCCVPKGADGGVKLDELHRKK